MQQNSGEWDADDRFIDLIDGTAIREALGALRPALLSTRDV